RPDPDRAADNSDCTAAGKPAAQAAFAGSEIEPDFDTGPASVAAASDWPAASGSVERAFVRAGRFAGRRDSGSAAARRSERAGFVVDSEAAFEQRAAFRSKCKTSYGSPAGGGRFG